MRAFGADDGKPTRTPAAWMISPCLLPSHQKHAFGVDDDPRISFPFPVPFSAWVTSAEHYWVTLAKHRSDTYEMDYTDGLARVRSTLSHATTLNPSCNALCIRVQTQDKQGLCHHLANEDRFKWVKRNA